MKYLALEETLRLHYNILDDFGGSHGVRDEGRLKSVVAAPGQEVFGEEHYPDAYDKAAIYIRNIIVDHPFVDGNNRSAITCAGIFLIRNGHRLTALPKELEDFAVRVAVERPDVPVIAAWLKSKSPKA